MSTHEAMFFCIGSAWPVKPLPDSIIKIKQEKPKAVFLGGDLLPSFGISDSSNFVRDYLSREFLKLKNQLGDDYPRVFMIMGNDDERSHEAELINCMTEESIWEYMHNRSAQYGPYTVYGYSYVPPTPFLNKDWERYDISRYLDPGCVAPDEGFNL